MLPRRYSALLAVAVYFRLCGILTAIAGGIALICWLWMLGDELDVLPLIAVTGVAGGLIAVEVLFCFASAELCELAVHSHTLLQRISDAVEQQQDSGSSSNSQSTASLDAGTGKDNFSIDREVDHHVDDESQPVSASAADDEAPIPATGHGCLKAAAILFALLLIGNVLAAIVWQINGQ